MSTPTCPVGHIAACAKRGTSDDATLYGSIRGAPVGPLTHHLAGATRMAAGRQSVPAKVTQLQTILEQWADTYGPLYTFRLGRKPVVVLAAPDLIQAVLRQRPETFRRMDVIAQVLEDVGGHGLFAAEGTAWRRQRRVVMPALSLPHVRQFFPILTAATAGLKTRWDRAARTGEVVDMPADLMRYTVEVITRVTFGDDLSHELAACRSIWGRSWP